MTARRASTSVPAVSFPAALARRRPDAVTVDRVLAAVLAATALTAAARGDGGSNHAWVALLAPALTLPIAVRRRRPLLVGAGIPVLGALHHAYFDAQSVAYPVAEFCALYALAAWTTRGRFAAGCAAFAAAVFAPGQPGAIDRATFQFVGIVLVAMVLVRIVVGDRDRRLRLADRERDLAAREAVVEERARIARELHDAIAHNVSMMVVQAGAERRVLPPEQSSTREVLETVEQIGRAALTEMRRLLGMLRSADGDSLTPQPGLRDLPTLVTQVREAGLPVELEIDGDPRELPVGLELSAYRIVQEALTNALKHAGEARAAVRVRYGPDSLELEIADDGAGAATPVAGGGHGLVGMRERVALYGGRFEADRRASGGFAVKVLLPVR